MAEIIIQDSGLNLATAILHPGAMYKGQRVPTQVSYHTKATFLPFPYLAKCQCIAYVPMYLYAAIYCTMGQFWGMYYVLLYYFLPLELESYLIFHLITLGVDDRDRMKGDDIAKT